MNYRRGKFFVEALAKCIATVNIQQRSFVFPVQESHITFSDVVFIQT